MKIKKKTIIIISICVLAVIGGVAAAVVISKLPKTIKAESISEALEIAKENGFEGSAEDWERIITTDNDTNQKGITKVYVDEDKHLIIVMDNGVTIDAGEANPALLELIKQKESTEKKDGSKKDAGADDFSADRNMIFTVTFKDEDGAVLKTENVIAGKSATPPPEPEKEGFRFDGWDTPFSYVQEDLVVTAIYKKSTNPTIALSSVSVKSGERTAKVNVDIANNPGISSLVLDINYPKEFNLKDVEFNQKSLDGAMSTTAKPFSNPQRISIIHSTQEMKTNGTIATLTFELPKDIKKDYAGEIVATYNEENVFDIDMNNVQFDIINGKILINK